ncbi:TetR/AcrR family transcriptional regulator [Nannocystis punicea]|uniref:TetR/AcrR family transcriptional regulator n=1 Tax=Nannocystis punicea TaxID=2995304 RepID=A0ABY7H858_9BACT|nr:TetR/AcrR family transcriptional regulator [Nannocystis poenicansa]WAS95224.1 TetR/AcrR family transcriptional regulator [Nannocystis poenicansa]
MRYPDDHKDAVRGRIVAAASRALRGLGLTGVGIPALMKRAGLTHGGFYRHFESRDELVAEALRAAADETLPRIFGKAVGAADPLAAVLDTYLSAPHRADAEHGCALAALGAEAPRQTPEVRRAFAEIARRFLSEMDTVVRRGAPQGELHDDALAITAAMIGGIVLARLVRDESLADRVLAATRRLVRRAT